MDIEQVIQKKMQMEREILDLVNKQFNRFEEETGLYPSSIDIPKIETIELGRTKPRVIFSHCDIIVEV